MSNSEVGAVVQPGLGRQIVNLEVAGSNPVGPATYSKTVSWDLNPATGGSEGGVPPSWGLYKGAGPFVGAGEARFRAERATERGSNPVGPATFLAGERKVVETCCVVTTG